MEIRIIEVLLYIAICIYTYMCVYINRLSAIQECLLRGVPSAVIPSACMKHIVP